MPLTVAAIPEPICITALFSVMNAPRAPGRAALVTIAIAYLALYVAHGFNTMTTIALLGTVASLLLTAVLAVVVVDAAVFSGFASEEAGFLQLGAAQIDVRGLVLAGIVIGALGAIDDMTVTQASAVWELHVANPDYGTSNLYRSAMQIGRDHVASAADQLEALAGRRAEHVELVDAPADGEVGRSGGGTAGDAQQAGGQGGRRNEGDQL